DSLGAARDDNDFPLHRFPSRNFIRFFNQILFGSRHRSITLFVPGTKLAQQIPPRSPFDKGGRKRDFFSLNLQLTTNSSFKYVLATLLFLPI
ncbi:MAG TPA: hypothetical protein VHV54_18890, partial [Candidatus Binatia bacterium]|nr:hypothetical protein [Candidatus Binatia bacterium]